MTALVGAGLLGGHALAVTVPIPTVPTVTAHGRATRATYGRRASPALDPSGIGAACRNSSLFGRRLDAGR